MADKAYDIIETGAPSFNTRLKSLSKMAKVAKRVIIRIQPYIIQYHKQILGNLELLANEGVYGVVVEGYKPFTKTPGMIKQGFDYVYPIKDIKPKLLEIKAKCHNLGLKFFSGENRLRYLGDSLTCCGSEGLKGFKSFKANANQYLYDKKNYRFTKAMKEPGSAMCFANIIQKTICKKYFKKISLKEAMNIAMKDKGVMLSMIDQGKT